MIKVFTFLIIASVLVFMRYNKIVHPNNNLFNKYKIYLEKLHLDRIFKIETHIHLAFKRLLLTQTPIKSTVILIN